MTTKELVRLHNEDLERDGLMALAEIYSLKMFRDELNAEVKGRPADGGYQYRNFAFTNRKRAYGDYLYYQDRDMFECNYRDWLLKKKGEQEALIAA